MMQTDKHSTPRKTLFIGSIATLAVIGLATYFSLDRTVFDSAQETAPETISRFSKPDPSAALKELYGSEFSGESIKTESGELVGFWFEQSFAIGGLDYHVIFGKTQKIDPETGAPLDSHVQGVKVGAATYRLDSDGWRAIGMQTGIGEIGSWGEAPDIKQAEVLTLSPERIAFMLDFGYGMGGYFDDGKVLFGFDGTTWIDLGFVQTGGNNAGACDDKPLPSGIMIPCWSYTGTISVLSDIHHGYPDLLVARTGTQSGDEQHPVKPAENAVYRFDGDKYADTGRE
ncbi:hypothetical protein [Methylotuvimicrobium sp. KM1]|uniref:hypothetical protein n=1 Tax=Methylotuvimicrobium sp. KM1 TaxID=3377707 RepID=UPI00384C1CCB